VKIKGRPRLIISNLTILSFACGNINKYVKSPKMSDNSKTSIIIAYTNLLTVTFTFSFSFKIHFLRVRKPFTSNLSDNLNPIYVTDKYASSKKTQ